MTFEKSPKSSNELKTPHGMLSLLWVTLRVTSQPHPPSSFPLADLVCLGFCPRKVFVLTGPLPITLVPGSLCGSLHPTSVPAPALTTVAPVPMLGPRGMSSPIGLESRSASPGQSLGFEKFYSWVWHHSFLTGLCLSSSSLPSSGLDILILHVGLVPTSPSWCPALRAESTEVDQIQPTGTSQDDGQWHVQWWSP